MRRENRGRIGRAAAVLPLAVCLGACGTDPGAGIVEWEDFQPGVLQEAREQGRPVILDFYANWCVPRLEMENYTFKDARVVEASRLFANLRLDLSSVESFDGELPADARRLVDRFRVMGLPTMIFLDSAGQEVGEARVTGYLDPEEFLPRMELAAR